MAYRVLKVAVGFSLSLFLLTPLSGCKNSKAVCPGAGQSKAADFSPFNENGEPKTGKKKKADNGLVKKKQPAKLNKK